MDDGLTTLVVNKLSRPELGLGSIFTAASLVSMEQGELIRQDSFSTSVTLTVTLTSCCAIDLLLSDWTYYNRALGSNGNTGFSKTDILGLATSPPDINLPLCCCEHCRYESLYVPTEAATE